MEFIRGMLRHIDRKKITPTTGAETSTLTNFSEKHTRIGVKIFTDEIDRDQHGGEESIHGSIDLGGGIGSFELGVYRPASPNLDSHIIYRNDQEVYAINEEGRIIKSSAIELFGKGYGDVYGLLHDYWDRDDATEEIGSLSLIVWVLEGHELIGEMGPDAEFADFRPDGKELPWQQFMLPFDETFLRRVNIAFERRPETGGDVN